MAVHYQGCRDVANSSAKPLAEAQAQIGGFIVLEFRIESADGQQVGAPAGKVAGRRPRHHFVAQVGFRIERAGEVHETGGGRLGIQAGGFAGQGEC